MIERLRILGCDHLNLARGKYIPLSKVKSGVAHLCRGVYAVTYQRDLLPSPGSKMLEGLPDMQARWDPDALFESWEEGEKIAITDYYTTEGEPLSLCGRGALKRAIDDWDTMGFVPKIGIELEAYAFIRDDVGKLQPIDVPGSYVYSTGPHADPVGFIDRIWEKAERVGFPLEVITTEYDASQFEFVLTYGNAIKAVDNIFLFKQMAREIALQSGVILTFMPKPIEERGGCGVHINFSLFDKQGNPVLMDGKEGGPDHMADLAKECLAGLMQHHKALSGIIAPTVNSYARLQPASMSGYWQNWGGDHRSVTARISAEGGKKARIEHRMADSGANPYTTTAAVLQAARLGVVNHYPLQPQEKGDGFEGVGTKKCVGKNLAVALTDLEEDQDFSMALGKMLVDNHIFIKRAEIEEVAACQTDEEKRDYYIHLI